MYKIGQAVKLKECPTMLISGQLYAGQDIGYIDDRGVVTSFQKECGKFAVVVAGKNEYNSYLPFNIDDVKIDYVFPDGTKFDYCYGYADIYSVAEVRDGQLIDIKSGENVLELDIPRLTAIIEIGKSDRNLNDLLSKIYKNLGA